MYIEVRVRVANWQARDLVGDPWGASSPSRAGFIRLLSEEGEPVV